MTRRLFILSTLLFWLAVGGFWAAARWMPDAPDAAAADESYSLAEVAAHGSPADCWMAIGGQVYDFTAYLPRHPSDPALFTRWCGKEATQAYQTKTKGRPHSPYADQLLRNYRIGTLRAAR
jgi:cytochrome b involved in lipid metabolism